MTSSVSLCPSINDVLPRDLLLEVGSHLPSAGDIAALVRSCKLFHSLSDALFKQFFKRDVKWQAGSAEEVLRENKRRYPVERNLAWGMPLTSLLEYPQKQSDRTKTKWMGTHEGKLITISTKGWDVWDLESALCISSKKFSDDSISDAYVSEGKLFLVHDNHFSVWSLASCSCQHLYRLNFELQQ